MVGAIAVKPFDDVGSRWIARRHQRRDRKFVVVGFLCVVLVIAAFVSTHDLSRLVRASWLITRAADTRSIEARLSGESPWAPFRARGQVGSSRSNLQLASAVGSPGPNQSGTGTLHARGIAELLTGHPRQALANLTKAAESANDAAVWNDLAAALFETATRYDVPELLADGLAACDHAIDADADPTVPLFNRALLLERLGLREDAGEAWQRYLARDGSSAWAAEAREHLRRLVPGKPFLELVDAAAARDAFSDVRACVRSTPQEARARTEMQLLGRWGRAVLRGDGASAERNLRIARDVGSELATLNGDEMVMRAVAIIDGASATARLALASAHADYEDGLTLFQANRPGDAELRLRRAAASFDSTGSAMVRRALFFAANTAFEQGRREEAERELQGLLATMPSHLYAARAELLWQLGSSAASRAEWGEAIRRLEDSVAIFDRLGETRNAASVRRVLAVIFDRLGDSSRAWSNRMAAFRGLGDRSDLALVKALSSVAGAATLRRKWHTALSFLTLEAEIAGRSGNGVQLADALLSRAAVYSRLGDIVRARNDVAGADRAMARVKDAAYAVYGQAARAMVGATLNGSPGDAMLLLTEAIAFQSTKGDRMNLPGLYLQRARLHRHNGEAVQADADLQSGMLELERHRDSLPRGDARWGAFFAADELFEEAVDLAIERNDVRRAFAVVERGRARVVLESYGRSLSADALPPEGTIVVEYAALPTRLVVFVASASGITAVTTNCDRDALAAEVDGFASALQSDGAAAARQTGSELYRRLIDPVAAQVINAEAVVFVPDSITATVPFNALIDQEGHYLIERHAVVVAPSAAAFAAATQKRRAASAPKSVAIIANEDPDGDGARLGLVKTEARRIARTYAKATQCEGDDASLDAVDRALSSADVVHFAGHAVGGGEFLAASLVLRREGRVHNVTAVEIARLHVRNAPTVVLAGCSTARGEKRGIEGVLSVAHGFLVAGAPSVIATLWPIDDGAAATFFPRLHERLAEGLPPAEALRSVQLDAIRRGDVPPSLWAALIDIGN
jgi:CHAT domain-containing protein/tetratricopeptide (TPR) repeat protein